MAIAISVRNAPRGCFKEVFLRWVGIDNRLCRKQRVIRKAEHIQKPYEERGQASPIISGVHSLIICRTLMPANILVIIYIFVYEKWCFNSDISFIRIYGICICFDAYT